MLEIYDKRIRSRYMAKKIGALIVLYEPDVSGFKSTFDSLLSQVDGFCIVDNSIESHSSWFEGMDNVIYLPLFKNIGIAAAQNIGIEKLRDAGYEYILFADQDSIAFPDLVEKLYSAYQLLVNNGFKISIVGCKAIDKEKGFVYNSNNVQKYRQFDICGRVFVHVDYVRNSISLTKIDIIDKVGGMDEQLFIDGVDCEWCWRAKCKFGLMTISVNDAYIYHSLGHNGFKVLNKFVTIPASFRLFYQYRNYFWLLRRDYVPLRWKVRNGIKYIVKVPYMTLFVPPRLSNLKNICRGVIDGITKKHNQEWHNIPIKKAS